MTDPMRSHSNKSGLLPNLSLTPLLYALLPFLMLCNTGESDAERGDIEETVSSGYREKTASSETIIILDTVAGSMDRRFSANAKLASDFACLEPKNFPEIKINGLPNSALQEISKCLLTFDDRATVSTLQTELSSLAYQWERLKKSSLEGNTVRACSEVAQEGQEDSGGLPYMEEPEMELESRTCSSCKNWLAYKFLLTLSITQVACERSFSTLTFVKNRLRSS